MSGGGQKLSLAVLNIIGFLGMVTVNGLATTLPLNDKTTGALSDQYPNLFVPTGITFSIWGVIYILLAVFVIYGLVAAIRKDAEKYAFLERIGLWFFISCLANIGWIFAWHYELVPLSLVLMLVLLACLLAIYLRLGVGKLASTKSDRYLVYLPFSFYLGWITVATIANVTTLLVDIGWNGFGVSEQFWAVLVIAVAIAITLAVLFTRRDIFYCLVVDWAVLGILLKWLSVDTVPDQAVVTVSVIGLALISVGITVQLIRRKVY